MTKGSKRFRILSGITELAHDVGLPVVAEGVEDASTLETVLAAGCDAVQGFYFSKPMTIDQLLAYKMPFKRISRWRVSLRISLRFSLRFPLRGLFVTFLWVVLRRFLI